MKKFFRVKKRMILQITNPLIRNEKGSSAMSQVMFFSDFDVCSMQIYFIVMNEIILQSRHVLSNSANIDYIFSSYKKKMRETTKVKSSFVESFSSLSPIFCISVYFE